MPVGDLAHGETRRLRIAVVGIGYLGKFHVQKYAAMEEVEIAGLVDIVPDKVREWAEKVGTRDFTDYRRLLGKVDAVSIVVPTDRHHQVARDFLQAGSDVLVEKPIASSLVEADDLIATARKYGRILQIGHIERFNPAIVAARKKIHTPLFIESHRLTPFRGRGIEVDVVLDLMIHDLDIVLSLVRSPAEHIHAVGVPVLTDKVDIASARVQFASGCAANITASRVTADDQRRIRLFQPENYVTADYVAQKVTLFHRVFAPGSPGAQISMETVRVEPADALEEEIRSFVRSSINRTTPPVTGEDGRNALALALEINHQIQDNFQKIPSIIEYYRDHGS